MAELEETADEVPTEEELTTDEELIAEELPTEDAPQLAVRFCCTLMALVTLLKATFTQP